MNITPDPEFRAVVLKKIADREFKERTGVHCSDLIYCLNKQALRRLHPEPNTDNEILLFSLGYSTQRWLSGQDKDMPEIEQDGIIVTCDSEFGGIPWELKASFQSSDRPMEENDSWLRQIMAQCFVTGTANAKLTRLEVMGNWKSVYGKKVRDDEGNLLYDEKKLPENQKPTLSAWNLEFNVAELCLNWEWLLHRRDQFKKLLEGGKLLDRATALPPSHDWECGYCSYNGKECPTNDKGGRLDNTDTH